MSFRAVIRGSGSFLPEKILTNDDLSKMVDTDDRWIRERTGIRERRIAEKGQYTSDLAVRAAESALQSAGMSVRDIDLVVVATATPDRTFPSTASVVQGKMGICNGAAFDIQAVCTGFIYALSTVEKFLVSGQHRRALLIGAETFSRILDWKDRSTCVLFGDGAGAFVLERAPQSGRQGQGVLSAYLRCDGSLGDLLYVDGGVSLTGTAGFLKMQGSKVFRHAVSRISEAMKVVMEDAGFGFAELDWVVPHQANARILDGVARKLDLDPSRVISTIAVHGNTSAASIPLAYQAAVDDGRITTGDLVLFEAMGAGLTWGAALVRV